VSVIDPTTNRVSETVPAGTMPVSLAVPTDGSGLYVGNYLGTVSLLAFTPTKPLGVHATEGNAEVSATWSAPQSNGGHPITGYTATATPGGRSCTTTGATSCTIAGLTNGTAYTVVVTASSSVGVSEASDPSNAVTPTAPGPSPTPTPGTVTKVKAKATTKKVTVKWKAAPSATKYTVKVTGRTPVKTKYVWKKTTVKTRVSLKVNVRSRSKIKVCITPRNDSGSAQRVCSTAKVS
jgi:serine protease